MRILTAAPAHPHQLSAALRLRKPSEFARVLAAAAVDSLRATAGRLSMKAVYSTAAAPRVRLGITVGKRNARRAVDRSLVKRVVRESFRAARPDLEVAIGPMAIDISIRLSAPLRVDAAAPMGASQLRRTVRGDADQLFQSLANRLAVQPGVCP